VPLAPQVEREGDANAVLGPVPPRCGPEVDDRQREVVCPEGDADRSKPRSWRRSPRLAEALTTVATHADARGATVCAPGADGTLRCEVRDDGVGGAQLDGSGLGGAQLDGSGLVGLAERLSVLGGRLAIDSPRGGPTVIAADIPLAGP
jgi:hypothetical protein